MKFIGKSLNGEENTCCPHCSSYNIIRKGSRERKEDVGHIKFCKNCAKYFTYPYRKIWKKVVTDEILEQYIRGKSLREFNVGCSKSTLHRQIFRKIDSIPSWEGATAKWLDQLENKNWFKNLVIDTTSIEVCGKRMTYLHAADNYFKRPLIYTLIVNENKDCIAHELQKLKSLGYYPNVTTLDLAPELVSAVEEVYRWTKTQGCLYHLAMLLREQLNNNNVPENVALLRGKAKNLMLHAACADSSTRSDMVQKLLMLQSSIDKETRQVVRNFLDRYMKLYHTLEELDGHAEALTTNLCERHIGLVKNFKSRLYGFKSFNTAQKLLNAYWHLYMRENNKVAEKSLEVRSIEGAAAFLLDGHLSISRLSKILRLPGQYIIEIAKKKGKTIILDYPISRKQIQRILELASKVSTAGELAEIMALDPRVVWNVLTAHGFKVKVPNPQTTMDEVLNFQSYVLSRIENATIARI